MFRLTLIAGLMLLLPLSGWSNSVYKYRDASGVWHYSDQRPGGAVSVQKLNLDEESASVAAPPQVTIERRGSTDAPEFYAVNRHVAPIEVRFWLTEADNLHQRKDAPINVVVPALGEQRIVALTPLNSAEPTRYRYQFRWQLGDPSARHAQDVAYVAPVPLSGRFRISQGFDGGFSHNTPGSRYAIDIPLPEGTPVMAARAGRVVSTRMESNRGGNSPTFRSLANTIYVEHDDGTYAVYAHLRHRSALVVPGDRVEPGQIIAQSGNTGYSTAPHLHFAVLRNAGLRWESEPFVLATPNGVVAPSAGLALNGEPSVAPADATPAAAPAAFGQSSGRGL